MALASASSFCEALSVFISLSPTESEPHAYCSPLPLKHATSTSAAAAQLSCRRVKAASSLNSFKHHSLQSAVTSSPFCLRQNRFLTHALPAPSPALQCASREQSIKKTHDRFRCVRARLHQRHESRPEKSVSLTYRSNGALTWLAAWQVTAVSDHRCTVLHRPNQPACDAIETRRQRCHRAPAPQKKARGLSHLTPCDDATDA